MRACNGVFMTMETSIFSSRSTSSTASHLKNHTKLATKYCKWSIEIPTPGQILRPPPNGRNLISFLPINASTSTFSASFVKNLSGRNSIGSFHTSPFLAISAATKCTVVFFGTTNFPSNTTSFIAKCGRDKYPGGCRLRVSIITAFRT